MIEKILLSYQQFLASGWRTPHRKACVVLEAAPLEERATPAAGLITPAEAPQVVWIAPILPTAAMVPVYNAPMAGTVEANVRADLFCSCDGSEIEQSDLAEDWFATQPSRSEGEATKHEENPPEAAEFNAEMEPVVAGAVFCVDASGEGSAE